MKDFIITDPGDEQTETAFMEVINLCNGAISLIPEQARYLLTTLKADIHFTSNDAIVEMIQKFTNFINRHTHGKYVVLQTATLKADDELWPKDVFLWLVPADVYSQYKGECKKYHAKWERRVRGIEEPITGHA